MSEPAVPLVAVFGASNPAPGEAEYETACACGRVLAAQGYGVLNGGYSGTMAASARGARERGGPAVGVTCSIWSSGPNEFLTETLRTDSLEQRLQTLVARADGGYVVLPGGTGTLLELALVWEKMCKRLMPVRPLVCVGAFWQPLIDMMIAARARSRDTIALVTEPEQLAKHFPPVPGRAARLHGER